MNKSPRSVFIYGAGGHGRELAWIIDSSPEAKFKLLGFVDDLAPQAADWQDSRPVMYYNAAREVDEDAGLIIGIGSPRIRRRIAQKLALDNLRSQSLLHSSVNIGPRVLLGEGCVIFPGCQLSVDIEIGQHVHINQNSTVSHDSIVGDFTTISPGVSIGGNVVVGKDVYIGIGASILSGYPGEPLVIGDGAVIAAGACVTKSVEPKTLSAGVPSIFKKRL